jgi:hypothetical protein
MTQEFYRTSEFATLSKVMVAAAKRRRQPKEIPATITWQWVIDRLVSIGGPNSRCEVTGDLLDFTGKNTRFTPTLDQIVPKGGCTPDNIQIVTTAFRNLKSGCKLTTEETLAILHGQHPLSSRQDWLM